MEKVTLVRQYAKALFGLCPERQVVDRVAEELRALDKAIAGAPEAHDFLFHPEIPKAEKRALLAQLLPQGLTTQSAGLIELLTQRRHLRMMPEIIQQFLALREASFGVLSADVESALPLSEELRARLQQTLVRVTGHGVTMRVKLNPELLGGVRIRVGDRIVDGSIAGRLKQIREALL